MSLLKISGLLLGLVAFNGFQCIYPSAKCFQTIATQDRRVLWETSLPKYRIIQRLGINATTWGQQQFVYCEISVFSLLPKSYCSVELVLLQKIWNGSWGFPCREVQYNENPKEAAAHKLWETIFVSAQSPSCLSFTERHTSKDRQDKTFRFLLDSGVITKIPPEKKIVMVDKNNLRNHVLHGDILITYFGVTSWPGASSPKIGINEEVVKVDKPNIEFVLL
ncbi:MAG: hypothetical protein LBJ89_02750 [Holosporales bacterium]|nr:hypothetical protein [Holosporales bacterium]